MLFLPDSGQEAQWWCLNSYVTQYIWRSSTGRVLDSAKIAEGFDRFHRVAIYDDVWRNTSWFKTLHLHLWPGHIKPMIRAAAENPDMHVSRSGNWEAGSAMSSAYSRSVTVYLPRMTPFRPLICTMIQSMAGQKRAGARTHPWQTPDVAVKQSVVTDPTLTRAQGWHQKVMFWSARMIWLGICGGV